MSDVALPGSTPIAAPPASGLAARRLTLLPLVMVMFFTVSGGAYGLEDLVGFSGPGMALVLLVVTPLIWSVPTALMVAELSTAIPAPGGYYAWVKRAMGPFWGFQAAWLTWVSSFVDMAIYPVLFADYLSSLLVQAFGIDWLETHPFAHWAVTLAVIWACVGVNLRGARGVGNWSTAFGVFVLLPFALMVVMGIGRLFLEPTAFWLPVVPPGTGALGAFGTGLFVAMWNYCGWESLSTVTDDVVEPRRTFPRALLVTMPVVVLAYLLPVVAGLAAAPDWTRWTSGYFPTIATGLGGWWLGSWLAVGGLVSAVALFNALLLSMARLPFLLADDGYLPAFVTRRSATTNAPWVAILVSASIYSLFTTTAFQTLVVVDVAVYSAALLLEFAALGILRFTEPGLERPVRVPGGWPGLVAVIVAPALIVVLAIYSTWSEEGTGAIWMSIAALATGPIAWLLLDRFVRGPQKPSFTPKSGAGGW